MQCFFFFVSARRNAKCCLTTCSALRGTFHVKDGSIWIGILFFLWNVAVGGGRLGVVFGIFLKLANVVRRDS